MDQLPVGARSLSRLGGGTDWKQPGNHPNELQDAVGGESRPRLVCSEAIRSLEGRRRLNKNFVVTEQPSEERSGVKLPDYRKIIESLQGGKVLPTATYFHWKPLRALKKRPGFSSRPPLSA